MVEEAGGLQSQFRLLLHNVPRVCSNFVTNWHKTPLFLCITRHALINPCWALVSWRGQGLREIDRRSRDLQPIYHPTHYPSTDLQVSMLQYPNNPTQEVCCTYMLRQRVSVSHTHILTYRHTHTDTYPSHSMLPFDLNADYGTMLSGKKNSNIM